MLAAGEELRMMGMTGTGMVKGREMGMETVTERGRMMKRKRDDQMFIFNMCTSSKSNSIK